MRDKQGDYFDLPGRVAIITCGCGLLGREHPEGIARAGGIPVLADIRVDPNEQQGLAWKQRFGERACAVPSTPDYVGVYQFVAVTILVPFGFPRAVALAYILVSQVTNCLLVTILGLLGLAQLRSRCIA